MRRRPRLFGAVAAMVLVVAACSSSGTTPGTTTVTTSRAPATTTATTSRAPASTAAQLAPATTQGPALEQVLAAALEAYASGYEFTAVASVGGDVATTIDGRWLNGASELSISSGGAEVGYLITEAGQWIRLPDGPWQELDGPPPVGNPLTALFDPSAIRSGDGVAGAIGLVAVYPSAVLGLPGETVEVVLTVRDAVLTQARYRAVIDSAPVEMVTVFTPLTDTSPINASSELGG